MTRKSLITLGQWVGLAAILLSACTAPATPPYYGAFLTQGSSLAEMPQLRGAPDSGEMETIPSTPESQPLITLWHPDVVLDYLYMRARAGKGDQVEFNVAPKDDGILEIRPKVPLDPGVYCLVQGNPLGAPGSLSHWCFQIEE